MKKTRKGFTLVEIMITMAIMAIVSTVIFTIFFTNNKMLTKAELKSDLQRDGDEISEKFVQYGSQSVCINSISGGSLVPGGIDYGTSYNQSNTYISGLPKESRGSDYHKVNKISLLVPKSGKDVIRGVSECNRYTLILDGNKLGIDSNNNDSISDNEVILSENVEDVSIKLLGFKGPTGKLKDAKGISLKVKFKKEKGKNEVTYELTNDIIFRNNQYKDTL